MSIFYSVPIDRARDAFSIRFPFNCMVWLNRTVLSVSWSCLTWFPVARRIHIQIPEDPVYPSEFYNRPSRRMGVVVPGEERGSVVVLRAVVVPGVVLLLPLAETLQRVLGILRDHQTRLKENDDLFVRFFPPFLPLTPPHPPPTPTPHS